MFLLMMEEVFSTSDLGNAEFRLNGYFCWKILGTVNLQEAATAFSGFHSEVLQNPGGLLETQSPVLSTELGEMQTLCAGALREHTSPPCLVPTVGGFQSDSQAGGSALEFFPA